MKNIIWLASYPKSGNTWVRSLLTALIYNTSDTFINELIAPIISSRSIIDEQLLLETSELTNAEIDEYTPAALRELSKTVPELPFFMKAHNAYTYTRKGEPLYPADVSIGAVYIARNVLDVVVSYAYHNNASIDSTIEIVSDPDFLLLGRTDDIKYQLPQKLLSWSRHVAGWIEQSEMPLLFVRYEDFVHDTFDNFKKIVTFSGLSYSDEKIADAIERTSFDKLKAQEARYGFKEGKRPENPFFRKGKIGSWRESLTDVQVSRIIENHKDMMLQLGYIDAGGNPLY